MHVASIDQVTCLNMFLWRNMSRGILFFSFSTRMDFQYTYVKIPVTCFKNINTITWIQLQREDLSFLMFGIDCQDRKGKKDDVATDLESLFDSSSCPAPTTPFSVADVFAYYIQSVRWLMVEENLQRHPTGNKTTRNTNHFPIFHSTHLFPPE